MATVGYARISTRSQSLDQQIDALNERGVERIFQDQMSGARDDRPALLAMLEYIREGDVVVVVALDRLGRTLRGIVETVATLEQRGVTLRSIRENVDASTAVGKMVMGIFATLSEYERTLILERAEAARAAARARGKQTGRPKAMTADQLRTARLLRERGESVPTICQALNVKRSTLYRELATGVGI